MRLPQLRRAATVLAATPTLLVGSLLAGVPAEAAAPVTPGSFTGFAFDACAAPSQADMDTWRTTSPFWAVGVYVGGSTRQCTDQPNLTASWVSTQSSRGWRVLPIWVGPQAACSSYQDTIDDSPASSYAAARAQGRKQASAAVGVVAGLGFGKSTTLWYDLEDFDLAGDDCRRSALSFLSAWTSKLHDLGYRSGVYSNVAAAVHALDNADNLSHGSYVMPDQVWYAWNNGRADTAIDTKWVRSGSWAHNRVHQYALDVTASYGGVSMSIDRSFLDVGRGSVAPKASPSCGVSLDFTRYRGLARGDTGAQVKAAQCLLRRKKLYDGQVTGRFDKATYRAVRSFQSSRALSATGALNAGTWTALLSDGSHPLLKRGSASDAVRRVQRGLNAASAAGLRITGVYSSATVTAVNAYQVRRGLPPTGVVASDTWADLAAGHH
jgi:hypothetical protein